MKMAASVLLGRQNPLTQPLGYSAPAPPSTVGLLHAYSNTPQFRSVLDRMATGVAMPGWHCYGIKSKGRFIRNATLQSAPPDVRRRELSRIPPGDLTEFPNHPMLAMIRSGNPLIRGVGLLEITELYIDIAGLSIWMLERRDVLGRSIPWRAWPIPPNWVMEMPNAKRQTYRIRFPSGVEELDELDVLRFHKPDLLDPYRRSSGVGGTLSDAITFQEVAAQHINSHLYNRAVPPFIGSVPGASEEGLKRLKARLLEETQGPRKTGNPFLINREMKIHELSQNLESMQFVELKTQGRDEFIQTFGLPPELIGVLQNSNRATANVANELHARYNLVPRLEFIRSIFQEDLAPLYDMAPDGSGTRLVITYDNPVAEDSAQAQQVLQSNYWAASVNEHRKLAFLPPIPNGDLHWLPAKGSWGEVGLAPPSSSVPPSPSPDASPNG